MLGREGARVLGGMEGVGEGGSYGVGREVVGR